MAGVRNTPHVARLCRYPVKGFGPEHLDKVDLLTNHGVPGDRAFAITDDSADVSDGAWMPCSNFVTLLETPDLTQYHAEIVDAKSVCISGPDDATVTLMSSGPAGNRDGVQWRAWFATDARPRLAVASDTGYWDHHDAQVSIINLATLRSLGEAAGVALNPLRFRANIYVDGLEPWAELNWIGHDLSLGAAELRVLRPIDRCAVTSVDPQTGARDVNVPYVLGRHFGHVFCGVYARVTGGARIEQGTPLEIGPCSGSPGLAATAAAVTAWPRPFRVVAAETETPAVRSLWLADPFAVPDIHAGEHVRVYHLGSDRASWRSYTISGWTSPGRLRITVKREPGGGNTPPGRVSNWLHDSVQAGDTILASGPHGGLPAFPERAPLVLVSGGIGITPTAAVLHDIMMRGEKRAVHVLHGARTRAELALWTEVQDAVRALGGSAALFLSREDPQDTHNLGAHAGRIPSSAYLAFASVPGTKFHLCGPAGMVRDVQRQLRDADVDDERIMVELFASPRASTDTPRPVASPGPFEVTFQKSGRRATWEAAKGSLLELADQAGLDLPAGCRSGGCMTCRQRILSGHAQAFLDPPVPLAPGEALLCSSVPASDVVIDA